MSLIILKSSHPIGPIFGQYSAGLRPGAGGVRTVVPFQCPQFLESDSPDGPIQEQAIDVPVVSVYAEGL